MFAEFFALCEKIGNLSSKFYGIQIIAGCQYINYYILQIYLERKMFGFEIFWKFKIGMKRGHVGSLKK